jgi:hypothetical protein
MAGQGTALDDLLASRIHLCAHLRSSAVSRLQNALLADPLATVTPLAEFLRRAQARAPMAGVVEPALYRSRKA